MLPVTRFILCA